MTSIRDRIYGSLVLGGIGDALGAPTELWSIEEVFSNYGGLATRFETPKPDTFAGAFGGKRGEVTDDASQMYYLARAILKADGRLDQDAWVACLLDWAATSPKATLLGPTTSAIVNALREGKSLDTIGVVGTSKRKLPSLGNTNGAAMRVAPTGLVHPGDIASACDLALVTCLPSHDTDVAIASACSVAAGAAAAAGGAGLEEVIRACREGGVIGTRLAEEHGRVPPGPRYTTRLDMALQIAAQAGGDDRRFLTDLEAAIGTGVLACESVPASIAILAYAKGDPLRTVALGASAGGDTDTLAAMAGAIVGAMVGKAGLPEPLASEFLAVNDAEYGFDKMTDGLALIAERNAGNA